MLWQARPGLISGSPASRAPAPAGGAAYTYLGNFDNLNLPAGNITIPMTMTGNAGLLVIWLGLTSAKTLTGAYDPTGANVPLTQDGFNNTGHTQGIWSASIPAASGSKNIVFTPSASVQFQAAGAHAWLCTNMTSSVAQTAVSITNNNTANLSVTAGDFLFGGGLNTSGVTAVDWATSTQVPATPRSVTSNNFWGR